MKATIKNGQSLADFAIEQFGAWEAMVDIALLSGIPMSEVPAADTELTIPDNQYNIQMQQFCQANGVSPATMVSTSASQQGIFTIQFTPQFT
jgi:hypothetical protein